MGKRTLVARTCLSCGKLADADSFPVISGVGAKRRSCHDCINAQKKRDREERGIGLPAAQIPPEDQQFAKYRHWSTDDDRYLREHIDAESYEDLAVALGRSLRSVYKRRDVLGLAVVRKRHRVADPWRITPGS